MFAHETDCTGRSKLRNRPAAASTVGTEADISSSASAPTQMLGAEAISPGNPQDASTSSLLERKSIAWDGKGKSSKVGPMFEGHSTCFQAYYQACIGSGSMWGLQVLQSARHIRSGQWTCLVKSMVLTLCLKTRMCTTGNLLLKGRFPIRPCRCWAALSRQQPGASSELGQWRHPQQIKLVWGSNGAGHKAMYAKYCRRSYRASIGCPGMKKPANFHWAR